MFSSATSVLSLAIGLLLTSFLISCRNTTSGDKTSNATRSPIVPSATHISSSATGETADFHTETPLPVTPTPVECTQPRILVFGKPISGGGEDHGYYLVCSDGSNVVRLTADSSLMDPSASLVSSLIAFAHGSRITILDPSGVNIETIRTDDIVADIVASPSWSPDGEYIAYIRGFQDLEVVHVESSTISRSLIPAEFEYPVIHGPAESGFAGVAWSPDGHRLVLSTNYDSLYMLAIDCDSSTHTCSTMGIHSISEYDIKDIPSWSPAGDRLAVICYERLPDGNQERSLCIIDPDGHVVEKYTSSDLGIDLELATSPIWSPDGNRIAFSDSTNVWILSLENGTLVNLTRELLQIDIGVMMAWVP